MSQWTHINGSIRLDGLYFDQAIDKIPLALGPTCTYDDCEDIWNAAIKFGTPCGGEGSMQHKFVPYGEGNHLALGQIMIWGDLRDKGEETVEEVFAWVNKIQNNLKDIGFHFRNCIIEIEVERGSVKCINQTFLEYERQLKIVDIRNK